ncbi:unnamed protein product, partial [marine sediment metagenome]
QGLTATYLPKLIGKLVGGGGLKLALSGLGNIIPGIGTLIGAAGPIGIAVVAIGAAVAIFAAAWKGNWFGIRDHAANAVKAIKGIAKGLADTLKGALKAVTSWGNNVVNKAKSAWQKAAAWLKKATSAKSSTPTPSTTYTPPSGFEDQGGIDYYGQHGFEGMVRKPTTFLAGEAGPEYVSISPRGRGGRGLVIYGPLIQIMGSADEATVDRALEKLTRRMRKLA